MLAVSFTLKTLNVLMRLAAVFRLYTDRRLHMCNTQVRPGSHVIIAWEYEKAYGTGSLWVRDEAMGSGWFSMALIPKCSIKGDHAVQVPQASSQSEIERIVGAQEAGYATDCSW